MSGANHPTAETFDRRRFEQAPCYICGYNGAGYYHSGLHRCAALYHGYKLPQEAPLTSNERCGGCGLQSDVPKCSFRCLRAEREIARLTRERDEAREAYTDENLQKHVLIGKYGRLRVLLLDAKQSVLKAADADCVCVDGPQRCKYCLPHRALAERIDAALSGTGPAPETTGKSRSAYISDLTVRRLDSGYVVTWQEDGEPCGSETISEKLAYALVRADGGILGITDDSAVKASDEPG